MLVMIPTTNSKEIGVRPVVNSAEADRIIASIPNIEVDMTATGIGATGKICCA